MFTNLPLANVPAASPGRAGDRILHRDLRRYFAVGHPHLVAGLNPHPGEGGHLGREEIDVIEPALDEVRAEGMDLTGPLRRIPCLRHTGWTMPMRCWPCLRRACRC